MKKNKNNPFVHLVMVLMLALGIPLAQAQSPVTDNSAAPAKNHDAKATPAVVSMKQLHAVPIDISPQYLQGAETTDHAIVQLFAINGVKDFDHIDMASLHSAIKELGYNGIATAEKFAYYLNDVSVTAKIKEINGTGNSLAIALWKSTTPSTAVPNVQKVALADITGKSINASAGTAPTSTAPPAKSPGSN